MPIYAYRCASCGHAKDVLQKLSDPPLTQCPACGAFAFSKQVTAAGFQLKGSGWYATDFKGDKAAKQSTPGEGGSTEAGKSEPAKTDSGKTEATQSDAGKSDSKTKSESKSESSTPAKSGDSGTSSTVASPKAAGGERSGASH